MGKMEKKTVSACGGNVPHLVEAVEVEGRLSVLARGNEGWQADRRQVADGHLKAKIHGGKKRREGVGCNQGGGEGGKSRCNGR